jgi:uridine kinase
MSPEGYLRDSYDPAALRRLVLEPVGSGRPIVPASFDLAADRRVSSDAVPVPEAGVVLVEGEFLLGEDLGGSWDLGILLVADPAAVLERAMVRDADLAEPGQLRELYLRRYLGAWALYEGQDPWSRADVVVDLTDPETPRLLG